MENRNTLGQLLASIAFLLLQVLLVRYISLGDYAWCMAYLAIILLLPLEVGVIPLMLIGFGSGLVVDIFGSTPGIHAAATVLLAFTRNFWLGLITPQGGYEQGSNLLIQNLGFTWFLTYAYPLIFIHHLLLFALEAGNLSLLGSVLLSTLLSSFFTLGSIVLIQYLFYKGGRR